MLTHLKNVDCRSNDYESREVNYKVIAWTVFFAKKTYMIYFDKKPHNTLVWNAYLCRIFRLKAVFSKFRTRLLTKYFLLKLSESYSVLFGKYQVSGTY